MNERFIIAILLWGFIIALLLLGYFLMWNLWRHWQQQKLAEARGWRYLVRGWSRLWRRRLALAGSTPGGAAWELHQLRRYHQAFFEWRTEDVGLPYGMLALKPAHPAAPRRLLANPALRPFPIPNELWNSEFVLLVTHKNLGERYFTAEVERLMRQWPRWPAPGSLEEIVWDQNTLVVLGRSAGGWELLERLVNTGTVMADLARQFPREAPVER